MEGALKKVPEKNGGKSLSGLLVALFLLSVFMLCASCTSKPAGPGVTGVWAVDESEKVKWDDFDHWAKVSPKNTIWDGKEIRLFGARNEIVGFQVILEARGSGALDVNVRLDSLSSDRFVLKNQREARDVMDFVGKRIELFVQSYVLMEKRGGWWIATARPLPDEEHTGWIPDALVPFEVQGFFEHGSSGAPFDIASRKNQGVWVDVFVPKECPAGELRGNLLVTEHGQTTYTIPVSLMVYDFTLPDTIHLRNHFFWGWPTITKRHGYSNSSAEYWTLFHDYANLFHRHRLDLIDGTRTLDTFRVQLAGYYSGSNYTAAYKYDGPGIGVGNQTYSIGTYDQPTDGFRSGFYPDSPRVWQAAADAWEEWFRKNTPTVLRFKYLEDEPPYAHWPAVKEKALWIKASPGVGKYLNTHVTTRMGEELFGAITLWMVGGHSGWPDSGGTTGFDIPVVRRRQAAGDLVGFYNGQRPSYGDPGPLDNFATDARVNPWISWKYDVDLYFYWEVAFYADNPINGWAEAPPGSLVYTGEDIKYPGESRKVKGPIASIRLKNLRRGMQDFEYLWLARKAGIRTDSLVNQIVPGAFNDYNGSSFTNQGDQPIWAFRGHEYENARRKLAELLHEAAQVARRAVPQPSREARY